MTVASCLKDGTIVETENSIIITKIVNSKRSITADGFTTIAVKERGDRIVEAISGDYRELVKFLSVIDDLLIPVAIKVTNNSPKHWSGKSARR